MFFRKKSHTEENVANKSLKKMDTVVTGIILGGIIASIYGMKKRHDKQQDMTHLEIESAEEKQNKQSLLSRIIFGDK